MKTLIIPFEDIEKEVLERIGREIALLFDAETEIHGRMEIPNCEWRGEQADATGFIPVIHKAAVLKSAHYGIGVTKRDIYYFYEPELRYLFGFASGNSCIVSTARIGGEFLKNRIAKEAAHELGRCLGIPHCGNPKCVMYPPNSVEELDSKGREPCSKCRGKISAAGKP